MLYETGWGNHVSSKGKNKHNYTPHKLDKEENERKGKERKGKGGNDQHHYYYCY